MNAVRLLYWVKQRKRHLTVEDPLFANKPVDMPMQVMLGGTPRMQRSYETAPRQGNDFDASKLI